MASAAWCGSVGGQSEPSTGAKSGSAGLASAVARARPALRVHASAWLWQVPQERPLVPNDVKKALVLPASNPVAENDSMTPNRSRSSRAGSSPCGRCRRRGHTPVLPSPMLPPRRRALPPARCSRLPPGPRQLRRALAASSVSPIAVGRRPLDVHSKPRTSYPCGRRANRPGVSSGAPAQRGIPHWKFVREVSALKLGLKQHALLLAAARSPQVAN